MLIRLLLEQAGMVPGQPIPPELQAIIDEQTDRVIERTARRVVQLLNDPNHERQKP